MYKTWAKILCGVLSAVCTLGFLNIDERDPETEKINLQSPSLVYVSMAGRFSNADVIAKQEEADRLAEEAETPEEADAMRIYNSEFFSLDNYTITAPANFEEIAKQIRKDENNDDDKEKYDGNSIWVRKPSKVYAEESTSSKLLANVGQGTKLIRISVSGEWSYVRLHSGLKGYIPTSQVSESKVATPTPTPTPTPSPTPKPKKKKPTATPKPKVKITSKSENKTVYATGSTNTRSGPGITYSKVSTIKAGTAIKVVARTSNGWYKSDKGWYILATLTTTKAPTAKKNTPTPTPKPKTSTKVGDKSGGFAKFIRSFVGCRYVSGGASPSGFDCSGFTMYCYKTYYNIKLPHGANMQTKHGTKVSFDSMKVGDIIYFDHDHNGKADHVGLYVGSGEMVHASGVKTGVKCVKVSKLKDIFMVRRIL